MTSKSSQRQAWGLIDGSGVYQSRAVTGGGYIFASTPPVTAGGVLADETRIRAPYEQSASARVRAQTKYIFERYGEALSVFGSSMNEVLQVEQYIPRKAYGDAYAQTSRGPGALEQNRPGSGLMQVGQPFPRGATVGSTLIAIDPRVHGPKSTDPHGLPVFPPPTEAAKKSGVWAQGTLANPVVTGGPYAFTTLVATDYRESDPLERSGIHEDVRVDQWMSWGSEIRNEAVWTIRERLIPRLEVVGATPADAVHCSVYITEIEDLYELDEVWRRTWPNSPPARTVIHAHGQGTPRWEGVRGHDGWGIRLEALFQALIPGRGFDRRVVETDEGQLDYASEAVIGGPLLWTSGQMAADRNGLRTTGDTYSQVRDILRRLEEICLAGGTTLHEALLLRVFLVDVADAHTFYELLRRQIPKDPPCVCVQEVRSPLAVQGATAMIDAVVLVDG